MEFTHIDQHGRADMVEVGSKSDTMRVAAASGVVKMETTTIAQIKEANMKKGDVLTVAQIAGIMGAKKTSDLIPLCHPILLTGINVSLEIVENGIHIESKVTTTGKTGVEMEALSAVSIAALTIYDMCKAVDKNMVITDIRLDYKSGGKSDYIRKGIETEGKSQL